MARYLIIKNQHSGIDPTKQSSPCPAPGFGIGSQVKGFGRQKGQAEIYRSTEYEVNFLPKVKLEIAVKEEIVEQVVEAVTGAAQTGKIGDGKIFVYSLDSAVRIRTGDTGAEAL